MTYLITAIVQDNREETMKVCARTDDSFKAGEAILEELAKVHKKNTDEEGVDNMNFHRACAEETWRIHSLHVDDLDDVAALAIHEGLAARIAAEGS